MYDKIKSFFDRAKPKMDVPSQGDYDVFNQIAGGFSGCGLLGCSNCSYDNTFPNIARIAEAFAEVMPYAIDERGEKLKEQPPIIRALYNPNEEMSGRDFFETLITMMMVHPLVYILLWHYEGKTLVPGGPVTKDNIAGFTFLEGVTSSTTGGVTTYSTGTQNWGRDDVIVLGLNVNPYALIKGYSPSMAVKKWAMTDDYIAEYQNGVFRNGAVPAGMFVLTAPSVEAYNEIVDSLQKYHRGAGNANNVMYVHRPTSAVDGKPMASQVEWVPFAQSNKDMTLEAVFNQANKKIDMNFGVPEEVKGYLQNSNYASAEVADYVFSRRVIYPKLVKVWSKFTHEMNRVTGGLECSVSFDYETPVLTDTRKLQAETLQIMLSNGFTVESAVEALQLPKSFLKLDLAESEQAEENLEAEPADDEKPSQNVESSKSLKQKAVDLETNQEWRERANPALLAQLTAYHEAIINRATELVEEEFDGTEESINRIVTQVEEWTKNEEDDGATLLILSILLNILNASGQQSSNDFAANLGIEEFIFALPADRLTAYRERIEELVPKFGAETALIIKRALEQSRSQLPAEVDGLPEDQVINLGKRVVQDLLVTNNYRIERWALSEQHWAENSGTLEAAQIAAGKSDTQAYKTWKINPASPDVCADCIAMDGETVPAGEPFSNGEMIPHYHPYCYCTAEFSFKPVVVMYETVKVFCPDCGRYMFDSPEGKVKNMICANSKCKKHFDITVKNGKAKFKEVKHDHSE